MKTIGKWLAAFLMLFIFSQVSAQSTQVLSRNGGERIAAKQRVDKKQSGERKMLREGRHARIRKGEVRKNDRIGTDRKRQRPDRIRKHRRPHR